MEKQSGINFMPKRNPQTTQVYMVGGGIASLVATVNLIHDAQVPASNIHILEAASKPGGALNSVNSAKTGYSVRGARKLNFTYHCLYDTLSKVPASKDGRTILQEIHSFNKYFNSRGHNKPTNPVRLVASTDNGPKIVDATKFSLGANDKAHLVELILREEEEVGDGEIQSYFDSPFFETIFWDLWSTMYGFQPWHDAKEFRRYLHRFLHEFPNLENLIGVERTPMNDYESVILPTERYLRDAGVNFRYGMAVKSIEFDENSGDDIIVSGLRLVSIADGEKEVICLHPQDILLVTLGSMVSGCKTGNNEQPPPPMPKDIKPGTNPVWEFWSDLANPTLNRHAESFGRPEKFYTRIHKSSSLSFTTTLRNTDFMERLGEWTGCTRESYPLITFRDSPWMITITVPSQPYFLGQPSDTLVIWGYGLFPDLDGLYVRKPMTKCSGSEIFQELLGHIEFPQHPLLERSTTIPVFMPFIGSPLVTRELGDRPQVVPEKSVNLGIMGQFVEMERDVTFTMEYSARSAQTAVFTLMGLDKEPHAVFRGDHSVVVLGEALKAIMT